MEKSLPSPEAAVKNLPDALVVSRDEPSKLIGTIRENLRRTTQSKTTNAGGSFVPKLK